MVLWNTIIILMLVMIIISTILYGTIWKLPTKERFEESTPWFEAGYYDNHDRSRTFNKIFIKTPYTHPYRYSDISKVYKDNSDTASKMKLPWEFEGLNTMLIDQQRFIDKVWLGPYTLIYIYNGNGLYKIENNSGDVLEKDLQTLWDWNTLKDKAYIIKIKPITVYRCPANGWYNVASPFTTFQAQGGIKHTIYGGCNLYVSDGKVSIGPRSIRYISSATKVNTSTPEASNMYYNLQACTSAPDIANCPASLGVVKASPSAKYYKLTPNGMSLGGFGTMANPYPIDDCNITVYSTEQTLPNPIPTYSDVTMSLCATGIPIKPVTYPLPGITYNGSPVFAGDIFKLNSYSSGDYRMWHSPTKIYNLQANTIELAIANAKLKIPQITSGSNAYVPHAAPYGTKLSEPLVGWPSFKINGVSVDAIPEWKNATQYHNAELINPIITTPTPRPAPSTPPPPTPAPSASKSTPTPPCTLTTSDNKPIPLSEGYYNWPKAFQFSSIKLNVNYKVIIIRPANETPRLLINIDTKFNQPITLYSNDWLLVMKKEDTQENKVRPIPPVIPAVVFLEVPSPPINLIGQRGTHTPKAQNTPCLGDGKIIGYHVDQQSIIEFNMREGKTLTYQGDNERKNINLCMRDVKSISVKPKPKK